MKEGLLVATGPIISALVEVAKALGLPAQYVKPLVLALTVAFFALSQVSAMYPETTTGIDSAVQILVILLGAFGFYDAAVKPVKRSMFLPK